MRKLFVISFIIFSFQFLLAREQSIIINLADAIKAVKQYHTSEQFYKDVEKVVDDGLANLKQLNYPQNAAFVFDVDETALSNMNYELKYNFGFEQKTWDEWVMEGIAPSIPGVKRLYDSLIARKIKIIFITGRSSNQYDITIKNLKEQGYTKFDTLVCKSSQFKGKKAVEYKSQTRKELSSNYYIIGSIGDQWSDLEGGWTIIKIKLPNYMYYLE